MKKLLLTSLLFFAACTTAGEKAIVTCYSGGKEIGKWETDGEVMHESYVRFTSKGEYHVATADCVVEYAKELDK